MKPRSRNVVVPWFVLAFAAMQASCDGGPHGASGDPGVVLFSATIQSVTVNPKELTLKVGEHATLTADVSASPGAVTSYNSLWTSADPLVANVSREPVGTTQVLDAITPGTTIITAASVVNPGVTGSASITVVAR